MVKFLLVLSLYYGCDALIVHRPLSLTPEQLGQCLTYYDAVKAQFTKDGHLPPPGTVDAQATRRAAFAAFKDWERDHAPLVRAMRAQARAVVTSDGAASR